jgi:hypothetical protein
LPFLRASINALSEVRAHLSYITNQDDMTALGSLGIELKPPAADVPAFEILRDRRRGQSLGQLARNYNASRATIQRLLREAELKHAGARSMSQRPAVLLDVQACEESATRSPRFISAWCLFQKE